MRSVAFTLGFFLCLLAAFVSSGAWAVNSFTQAAAYSACQSVLAPYLAQGGPYVGSCALQGTAGPSGSDPQCAALGLVLGGAFYRLYEGCSRDTCKNAP